MNWILDELPNWRATPVFVVLLLLLPAPQASLGQSRLIGRYKLKPQQLKPQVSQALPFSDGMESENLKLMFHKSVPLVAQLVAGKREGEYSVKSTPDLRIRKFILPGILNAKLRYSPKRQRAHRWTVYQSGDEVKMQSETGTWCRIKNHEFIFLDLNGDGAFGGLHDGYIVKPPKQKQWVRNGQDLKIYGMPKPFKIKKNPLFFRVSHDGFRLLVSEKAPDYSTEKNEDYEKGLAYLNELRAKLGFDPLFLDASLSRACEEHSLYCAAHGQTHYQDKKKPGYTKAGARAGLNSVLVPAKTMEEAIFLWLTSFYHRIDMLKPNLTAIGMGLINGACTMDVQSKYRRADFEPFCWPVDGAIDVPVGWSSGENPSPTGVEPFDYKQAMKYGYPITLTFPDAKMTNVTVSLTKKSGADVPCFVSTPEKPGNPDFKDNADTILLMSLGRLDRQTTYDVKFECTWRGKPFTRSISFKTK